MNKLINKAIRGAQIKLGLLAVLSATSLTFGYATAATTQDRAGTTLGAIVVTASSDAVQVATLEPIVVQGTRNADAGPAQLEEIVVWGTRESTEQVADNLGGGVTQSAMHKPLLSKLRAWIGSVLIK